MNQVERKRTSDDLQLNQRLWQAWQIKNRELDRAGAVKRWKILKIGAVIGGVAILVQSLTR